MLLKTQTIFLENCNLLDTLLYVKIYLQDIIKGGHLPFPFSHVAFNQRKKHTVDRLIILINSRLFFFNLNLGLPSLCFWGWYDFSFNLLHFINFFDFIMGWDTTLDFDHRLSLILNK